MFVLTGDCEMFNSKRLNVFQCEDDRTGWALSFPATFHSQSLIRAFVAWST